MQSFQTIKPHPLLAPYVKCYWILQDDTQESVSERILPVGSIQISFHKGKRLFSQTENQLQPQSLICGHSIGFSDVISTGDIEMITVVFQPHAAKMFFNLPISEFWGYSLSTDEIGDIELYDLTKRIVDTRDNDMCIRYIETFLFHRLQSSSLYHLPRVSAVINEIDLRPQATVTYLSGVACLSNKQFGRVFQDYIGATPKEFMRIVRMQRALYMLQQQPDTDFVQLACECGFFDQSHMIKEFKLFSGYTPMEYLLACAPYSDYFSRI